MSEKDALRIREALRAEAKRLARASAPAVVFQSAVMAARCYDCCQSLATGWVVMTGEEDGEATVMTVCPSCADKAEGKGWKSVHSEV